MTNEKHSIKNDYCLSSGRFQKILPLQCSFFALFWDRGEMDQRLVVSGTLEDCFAFYNRLDFAVRDEYYIVSVVPAFQIMIPN